MPALISELFTFFFRQHPSEIWTRARTGRALDCAAGVVWFLRSPRDGGCGDSGCDSFKDHHSCL